MITVFVALTFVAISIQAGVLIALYVSVKKTSAKMESIATEVQSRALPVLENANTLLNDLTPQLREITGNLAASSGTLKTQLHRVDSTLTELVDRSRLQIIRVDDLVTRTLDRVEQTTELLETTVVGPVKKMTGIMQALQVGLGAFLNRKRRQGSANPEDEEMFI